MPSLVTKVDVTTIVLRAIGNGFIALLKLAATINRYFE